MLLLFFISRSVAQCMIQQTLRGLCRIIVTATQGVCVDSQCDAGIGVPHSRGDGHGVDVICQQYGGVCVPKVVETYSFKTVGIREVSEPLRRRVMVQLRAVPCVDYPAFPDPYVAHGGGCVFLIGTRFMQHGHHTSGQRNQALACFRFRIAFIIPCFRRVLQGVAYVNGAVFPVYVRKPQRADFAEAQAAEQG